MSMTSKDKADVLLSSILITSLSVAFLAMARMFWKAGSEAEPKKIVITDDKAA